MASFRLGGKKKFLSSTRTNWCGSQREEDEENGVMRGGGLEENTSCFNQSFFFPLLPPLPTGSTCNPSPRSGIGVVTSGINVLGRFN